MNTHRIIVIAMAVAFNGFAQILVAEENISTTPAIETLQQIVIEQKPEMESTASEQEMSMQTFAQPADTLLSDLKVYPAF